MPPRTPPPRTVRLARTADLEQAALDEVARLLTTSFDDFSRHDWQHTLGGLHALTSVGAWLVGHGALVERRLVVDGSVLRAGYVEGVAVHPAHRGHGHGTAVMAALEEEGARAYPVLALSSTEDAVEFYSRRGWVLWLGPTWVDTPRGFVRTPDEDGGVYVRTARPLDVTGSIACDWRDGDVW